MNNLKLYFQIMKNLLTAISSSVNGGERIAEPMNAIHYAHAHGVASLVPMNVRWDGTRKGKHTNQIGDMIQYRDGENFGFKRVELQENALQILNTETVLKFLKDMDADRPADMDTETHAVLTLTIEDFENALKALDEKING